MLEFSHDWRIAALLMDMDHYAMDGIIERTEFGKQALGKTLIHKLAERRIIAGASPLSRTRKHEFSWYGLTNAGVEARETAKAIRSMANGKHFVVNGRYYTFIEAQDFVVCWCEIKLGISVRCYALAAGKKQRSGTCPIQFSVGSPNSPLSSDVYEENKYLAQVYSYLTFNSESEYLFQPISNEREPFFNQGGIEISFGNSLNECMTV